MNMKNQVLGLFEIFSDLIDSIDSIQNALIYNKASLLEEINPMVKEICGEESVYIDEFMKLSKEFDAAGKYALIPGHICKIGEGMASISDSFRSKIKEDILFSDKAVDEINLLFERLKDILRNTNDMILARNLIIANYVKESEADISRLANDFSTKHEERLIEGLCLPKASPIFLGIIDSIKVIAWHAKEIAVGLR